MGKPAATDRPPLLSLSHSFTLEFVDANELGRDEWALRRAVAEAGKYLLLHIEQGEAQRREGLDRIQCESHIGGGVMGLGCALCVGSTMVIVRK